MSRAGVLACAVLFVLPLTASAQPRTEYRAFWVDTFNTSISNHAAVVDVVNKAVSVNANAIFVQVRRRGDAFYLDALEPLPQANTFPAGFDPLQDLITEAHGRSLELHAFVIIGAIWNRETTPLAENHPFYLHGGTLNAATKTITLVADNWLTRTLLPDDPPPPPPPAPVPPPNITYQGRRFANDFWIDLGHPDASAYTTEVLMHLVRNYDIDGLHFDRIRYPDFTATGQTATNGTSIGYNERSVARFNWIHDLPADNLPAKNDPDWNQWRRDQVSNFVRRTYLSVMAEKPWVDVSAALIVYGGAPAEGDWTKSEAYWRVYQDWDAWMREGILDIAAPMNYKREHNAAQVGMFDSWNEWTKDRQYGRAAILGQAVYLNAIEGSLRQTRRSLQPSALGNMAAGTIFYNMNTSNVAVTGNPFRLPSAGNTPVRLFPEFASAYKTGRSVDGVTLYEPASLTPLYGDIAFIPAFPWKDNPQVGHIKGIIRGVGGDVVDTGAVTITRISGADEAPGKRSVTTATDGNGFYGGVDLAPGTYRVAVTPVREGLYVHQCPVYVAPGQVSTWDFTVNDPPAVSLAVSPEVLWPPNGEMHTITATVFAADDTAITLTLSVADEYGQIAIEPLTTSGHGPLSWNPTFDLESARLGDDADGRTYTMTLAVTDTDCQTTTKTATVRVAHDQRDKK